MSLQIKNAGIYEKFTNALTNAVEKLQVGDGFVDGVAQVI